MEGNGVELKKSLVSPKGANNEFLGKLEGFLNIYAKVVYIIFVPQLLHIIYVAEGFSRYFVHLSSAVFALLVIHFRYFELIGQRSSMVLLFPAMVGFLASSELPFLVYLVGGPVFLGIMFSVMIMFNKNIDRA